MKPSHLSVDGAYAIYLLAVSEGAFIGAALMLVMRQTFSILTIAGAVVGGVVGVLFARRYIRSNNG